MKKYIVPSMMVANVENEVILAGSNPSLRVSGLEVDGGVALGNRRSSRYFEEEDVVE